MFYPTGSKANKTYGGHEADYDVVPSLRKNLTWKETGVDMMRTDRGVWFHKLNRTVALHSFYRFQW